LPPLTSKALSTLFLSWPSAIFGLSIFFPTQTWGRRPRGQAPVTRLPTRIGWDLRPVVKTKIFLRTRKAQPKLGRFANETYSKIETKRASLGRPSSGTKFQSTDIYVALIYICTIGSYGVVGVWADDRTPEAGS
jgi:hypothetical protein